MNSNYDIYRKLPDDRLLWINRVKELNEARQLVAALGSTSMDNYLVYDFRARTVVEVFGPAVREVRLAAA
jgi:hypothetical protein